MDTADDMIPVIDPAALIEELAEIEAHLQTIASPALAGNDVHVLDWATATNPIAWIGERLALTTTEQRALAVLMAHELSPRARRLLRQLATEELADVTLDALRRAVYGSAPNAAAWRELGTNGALRRFGLIEATSAAGAAQYRQTIRLAPRLLGLAHGDTSLDDELHKFARLDDGDGQLADLEASPTAITAIATAIARGFVIVHGGIGTGRTSVLAALARRCGHRLLVVDGKCLDAEREAARRQLRIIARECKLFALVPLIRHLDALAANGDLADRLDLVETELSGLVLATATRPIARRWNRAPVQVELPPLTGLQRAKVWQRALPAVTDGDAELLATIYPIAPALIRAAGAVTNEQCGAGPMQPEHVQLGIRSVLDHRLGGLATRIDVTQTWDDLVLPEDQMVALVEFLARIRERRRVYEDWGFANKLGKGLGVSALFSGPPGTGKTMCAGLIARELGTELYQVDLSKITSKWIGETEKNLAAVFEAAEAGHAILLFDEADAIFGKRTDVKTSNDRHANQETNYLLQRIENFGGICILTTNHDAAIDEAFRRRLAIHVRFPMPDTDERTRLWQALIPASAPIAGQLRFDQLGETYVMTGGYIRNAVLRAAFLAADRDSVIDGDLLARAAQLEYESMGKVVARR